MEGGSCSLQHLTLLSPSHPTQIKEKYGPVFTVYMGFRRVVVLCGYDVVKEALVDHAEEFSDRAKMAIVDRLFTGYGE